MILGKCQVTSTLDNVACYILLSYYLDTPFFVATHGQTTDSNVTVVNGSTKKRLFLSVLSATVQLAFEVETWVHVVFGGP